MKDCSRLKRAAIVGLVCLNLALCVVLIYGAATPEAQAQVRPGYRNDYLVVTGRYGSNTDAVYVLDLGQRRLAAWRFDTRNEQLVPVRPGRELDRDFQRSQ